MVSRNLFAGAFASAITLLVATTMSIGPSQATTTTTTVITTTTSLGVEVVTDTTTTSSATVTPLFSVIPGEIFAGAQATLDLQLSLVGDVGIVFTGGSATLFFGDGGSALFNIGNSGGTFREFSATHAYSIRAITHRALRQARISTKLPGKTSPQQTAFLTFRLRVLRRLRHHST